MRPNLTWPCVSMEWKTPPIQQVLVSARSSGVRCRPARSMWPCGRSTASSLARSTMWWSALLKKDSGPEASASRCRRSEPNSVSSCAALSSRVASMGAVAKRLLTASAASPARARRPAASGSASVSSARVMSAALLAPGWSATKRAKKPARAVLLGASVIGWSSISAIACSCWNRLPGRPWASAGGAASSRAERSKNCRPSVP